MWITHDGVESYCSTAGAARVLLVQNDYWRRSINMRSRYILISDIGRLNFCNGRRGAGQLVATMISTTRPQTHFYRIDQGARGLTCAERHLGAVREFFPTRRSAP